jgi:mannose-1-phosphate guanylyltransferase
MTKPEDPHVYAVIMAGGVGSSLWPLSRKENPKQFIQFFDGGTMIRKTVERISGAVLPENIFIITGTHHHTLIRESLPDFSESNIIVEPNVRDTAPCIALATSFIMKRDPDAVTIVLPSDHLVFDEEQFLRVIEKGVRFAREKRGLVTIGIQPDRPETRYGYIQASASVMLEDEPDGDSDIPVYRVKTFAEKPDLTTAQQFLQSHDFWWNSGVFIWHVETISNEFRHSMPELYQDMLTIQQHLGTESQQDVIEDVYSWIHPISVDYGVMEKAAKVYMLEGHFGWTDLGCWDEVINAVRLSGGDGTSPDVVRIDSDNVFVRKPQQKVVVTIGLKDLIVIDTPDALMICSAGSSQDIRKAVDILRREGLEEYL